MKNYNKKILSSAVIGIALMLPGCRLPSSLIVRKENKTIPSAFNNVQKDTVNAAAMKWKDFFADQNLIALIDTALKNNQELNIVLQEINISKNEIRARKGEYLPFVGVGVGAGVEKPGRYTRPGAVEENIEIMPGKAFPEPLPDFVFGANLSWELDIWKKLRNSKKSAMLRYLSTVEGKNFMVTNLIAEISLSYYELMAFDAQLEILRKNIEVQQNALEIVKMEKEAAKLTELAVRKFEAEVLKNQSRQYYIIQMITEAENRINFLVGRFPQSVARDSKPFIDLKVDTIQAGVPAQLLQYRPDIRKAEQALAAAKLDVKAAKANFYPSVNIVAGVGYQAFKPGLLLTTPESIIYSLAGQLVAPLINRNAIKAEYYSANSRQIQAVYNYEQTILTAYIDVANQLSNISNLKKSYDLKTKQVQALNRSIDISTSLFKSARADYMEVLMTQRDALDSRFELIETKMQQMHARVNLYQSLGGGWK